MADRQWLVYRSCAIYRRDERGDLVRRTQVWADQLSSLDSAARHYNAALDLLWVEPGFEEPDITADAEIVAQADAIAGRTVRRVPMPPEIAAKIEKYRQTMAAKTADKPVLGPWRRDGGRNGT